MKTKDLKSKPSLVAVFEQYTQQIYNVYAVVPVKNYGYFQAVEEELLANNMTCTEYAKTVLSSMKPWVKQHNLSCLPARMFVSEFCARKFIRIRNSTMEVLDSQSDNSSVLYEELNVLRAYISSGGDVRLCEVVDSLRPTLSEKWIKLYINGKRPTIDALMILAEEYAVKDISLNNIVKAANGR